MENKSGITPTLAISCEDFEKIKNSIEEKDKEIERLNNIINELEKRTAYIYDSKTKTWLPLKGGDENEQKHDS